MELHIGKRRLELRIVWKQRMRNLRLRVLEDGRIQVSASPLFSQRQILDFVHRHRRWIERRLELQKRNRPPLDLKHSKKIPFLGRQLQVSAVNGGEKKLRWHLSGDRLFLWIPDGDRLEGALKEWYRQQAREFLERRVAYWAGKMGLSYRAIRVKNQRSRWGSCSDRGILNFNFRILWLPPDEADWVIVHELAHRRYPNHSREFWQLVQEYCPNSDGLRKSIRQKGHWLLCLQK